MSASFVLDCSYAMAWCFKDEETKATATLLDRMNTSTAAVPAWWLVEVTNVLALSERKGRITSIEVEEFIRLIEGFSLEIDHEAPSHAFTRLLPLCRTHRLTSYDAMYLELAARRRLPLATLDKGLVQAAKKLGVKVLGR